MFNIRCGNWRSDTQSELRYLKKDKGLVREGITGFVIEATRAGRMGGPKNEKEVALAERTRGNHYPLWHLGGDRRRGRRADLAVSTKDEAGNPVTRWHRCVDWQGLTATYRKGYRVSLTGFFKTRTCEKGRRDQDNSRVRHHGG